MKSDIEIAQEAKMKPIAEIAAGLGLADEDVIPYGRYKAKINHRLCATGYLICNDVPATALPLLTSEIASR